MVTRFFWPDCTLLTPQPSVAYFVECTREEALNLTPTLEGPHAWQQESHPAWPYCFLVSACGEHVRPEQRVLVFSSGWNDCNPFLSMEPRPISSLEELSGIQPVPAPWTWPDELGA